MHLDDATGGRVAITGSIPDEGLRGDGAKSRTLSAWNFQVRRARQRVPGAITSSLPMMNRLLRAMAS
jgi:hypothetical protein